MKTIQIYRIVNAVIWLASLAAIIIRVCTDWNYNGCEPESIWLAVAFYTTGCVGLGLIIDLHLRKQLKRFK